MLRAIRHRTRRLMQTTILLGASGCPEGEATLHEGAALARAPDAAKPEKTADIVAVSVAGSGCPPDSTKLFSYDDGFHLTFDAFELATAQGSPPMHEKLCTVSARVPGVAGWSYAVSQVAVSGGASLSDGTLTLAIEAGFVGAASSPVLARGAVRGPHLGRFRVQGEAAERVWSLCGATSDLVLKLPAAQRSSEPALSYLSSLTVALSWRRCP